MCFWPRSVGSSLLLLLALFLVAAPSAGAAPSCVYDSGARTLTIANGWVVEGVEQVEWCSWSGAPSSGREALVDRVDAHPSTGRALVRVRSAQLMLNPLSTWYVHAPSSAEAQDLRLALHLGENAGKPWTLRVTSSGVDIDGDGTLEVVFDQPDRWSIDLFVDEAHGSFDLRDAAVPAAGTSTVSVRSTPALPGSQVWGPRNGADMMITGSPSNDRIITFSGDDTISAGAGNDTIISGEGHDAIGGGLGNDIINAGAGHDRIDADASATGGSTRGQRAGNDIVRTGPGTSYVKIANGRDSVIGGPGTDVVELWYDVSADLRLGAGRDFVGLSRRTPRRIDCGPGSRDLVIIGARGQRVPSRGCESVGPFRLILSHIFPWGISVGADGITRGWICGNRTVCPAGRF